MIRTRLGCVGDVRIPGLNFFTFIFYTMSTPDLPPASPAPTPAPVPAPAKKSNTLVIVLCVVFGLLFLLLASCVGTCIYLGKKAKTYATESEKSPGVSHLALIAAITPGIEVVSKDLDAGKIVLKNKKTGELVTLSEKDFSQDKIASVIEKIVRGKGVGVKLNSESSASTSDSSSESSESSSSTSISAAQAAAHETTVKSFPSSFPLYNGGSVTTIEASQNSFGGVSTSQHTFTTVDAPDKVADFFSKKLTAEGYAVLANENGSDDNEATLTRVFQKDGMGSTVNLAIHIEKGKTHAEVNQVLLKQ